MEIYDRYFLSNVNTTNLKIGELEMDSHISWIDHDSEAKDSAMNLLSQLRESESRDELGLGRIRDSFSDLMFPGTSTIQTRLRYMFFVPWIYKKLEKEKVSVEKFSARVEEMEKKQIRCLKELPDNEDKERIIGVRAGDSLQQLPSSIYWTGLGKWGIRINSFPREKYHRRIGENYQNLERAEKELPESKLVDDYNVLSDQASNSGKSWHPYLPKEPTDFPSNVGFALTLEEAEFIQSRIHDSCTNLLLDQLAQKCLKYPTDSWWSFSLRDLLDLEILNDQNKKLLYHAIQFSEVMYGATILYNLELAKFSVSEHKLSKLEQFIPTYEKNFVKWSEELARDEVDGWDLTEMWNSLGDFDVWKILGGNRHSITRNTKDFVSEWLNLVKQDLTNLHKNSKVVSTFESRERVVKGKHQSKFGNVNALKQWVNRGQKSASKLNYRWPNVQRFITDLSNGLNRV